jgi:hypothetical protein
MFIAGGRFESDGCGYYYSEEVVEARISLIENKSLHNIHSETFIWAS